MNNQSRYARSTVRIKPCGMALLLTDQHWRRISVAQLDRASAFLSAPSGSNNSIEYF